MFDSIVICGLGVVTALSVIMANRHYRQANLYWKEARKYHQTCLVAEATQYALAQRVGEVLTQVAKEGHEEAANLAMRLFEDQHRLNEIAKANIKKVTS